MSGEARGRDEVVRGGRGEPSAAGRSLRSAVIGVGEELLLGETVDTNAAWLGRQLAALGAPVSRRWTVGDDEDAIREAVGAALEAAEIVIVTGGLGPTDDDRTKEAVAGLLGRELRMDRDLLELLAARFRELGYDELPPTNRSQAEVPEGAETIPNPRGTAPGLVLDVDGRAVVLLPGVPREMKGIFGEGVADLLRRRFEGRLRPVRHRMIHTTGVAESVLAERVEALLAEEGTGPVSVAFLPDVTGVALRLTVRGARDDAEARELLDKMEARLAPAVERHRYEAGSGDLAEAVSEALRVRTWTVATAESCTGGLVAKRLTDLPGSSDVFVGGVVSYADASKVRELSVSPELLEAHGAVSEEVVRAMVEGVVGRFGADCGISITGIAGPGGGSEEKPVGTVWYAVAVRGEVRSLMRRFPGERADVRERSAQAALDLLRRTVEEVG